jgi:subtilisin-like proprotein convertase family protein
LLITDVNVSVYMTHTYIGDVGFVLQHQPSGRLASFVDRPGVPASTYGCLRDDINAVLDDEAAQPVESRCAETQPTISGMFLPNNPLSAFDGANSAGNWLLTVTDNNVTVDDGSLRNWGLQICGKSIAGSSEPVPSATPEPFGYAVPVVAVGEDTSPPRGEGTVDLTNRVYLPQITN